MEDKDPTPPVQVTSEANDYVHIDTPETIDNKSGSRDKVMEETASTRIEFSFDILQTEYDIDPGNEHHHHIDNDANKDHKSSDKNSLRAIDGEDDALGSAVS